MADVLSVSGLRAGYGETVILEDVAFSVPSRGSLAILGRNGVGKTTLLATLDRLPAEIAILIIEHDMDLVFRFARRITVLVQGEVLVEGTPEEIGRDRRVHQVYLGEQHHA